MARRVISVSVTGDPDNPITVTKVVDEEGIIGFEVPVAAGANNFSIPGYALAMAKLKEVVLTVKGHNGLVTIETNDGAAADDTFTATADSELALLWFDGMGANPLTADVTGWFVTNAGTTEATVRLDALQTAP